MQVFWKLSGTWKITLQKEKRKKKKNKCFKKFTCNITGKWFIQLDEP